MSDDPFGRKGDEQTDPFGNPLPSDREKGVVPNWAPPEGAAPAPTENPQYGGFLPPTDAEPPDTQTWWAEPAAQAPSAPGAAPAVAGENADWGTRVLAAVVDFAIRLAIVGVFAGIGVIFSEDGLVVGLVIGAVLAIFVYAPVLLARWDGQTVGHRVAQTRIVMTNGSRMSGGRGFTREVLVKNFLIEGVGQFTFFVLPLVNYLWPLWDSRDEALHDKICDTRVIKSPR